MNKKIKNFKYIIFCFLFLFIICIILIVFNLKSQNNKIFKNADTLFKNIYTVDTNIATMSSKEQYELFYKQYEKVMSSDALENFLLNRIPVKVSNAVRYINGTSRFISVIYDKKENTEEYEYIVTVLLTINEETHTINPTGTIEIDSNGVITSFSEKYRFEQLIMKYK